MDGKERLKVYLNGFGKWMNSTRVDCQNQTDAELNDLIAAACNQKEDDSFELSNMKRVVESCARAERARRKATKIMGERTGESK